MDIAISSPTRLKNPVLPGKIYKPKREINRNEESNNAFLIRDTSLAQGSDIKVDISSLSKNKIDYPELVGTILHEALHYFAYFNKKEICEKDEHYVMRALGDDC